MSKILFIGDLHISDRQIGTRVDNITETCVEKLQWILDFAKSKGADIICTGDMFSHTLYSNKTRFKLKKMFRVFNKSGLSFWTISGNHSGDVEDRDISTVPYRELGQFVFDGYINYLGNFDGDNNDYIFGGLAIRGYSAYSDLNTDNAEFVRGLVCHHWIMDAFNDTLIVYPDDMKKVFPNLKFIVAGHDHAFHEPYTSRDGVLVVRPGSVMRTDSGKSSDRIPQVVLYTYDPAIEQDKWEYISVACARPYTDVFHIEKKQSDSESANALDRFVRQMQNSTGTVMDINSAIKEQLSYVPVVDQEMIKQDLVTQGYLI